MLLPLVIFIVYSVYFPEESMKYFLDKFFKVILLNSSTITLPAKVAPTSDSNSLLVLYTTGVDAFFD